MGPIPKANFTAIEVAAFLVLFLLFFFHSRVTVIESQPLVVPQVNLPQQITNIITIKTVSTPVTVIDPHAAAAS
jgi:hypothetical protein